MKKMKKIRKMLCAGLTLTMLAGLCACGNRGEGTNANSNAGSSSKGNANSALAKEYVYGYEEIQLPDLGDDMYINSVARYDGRVYVVMNVYHWDEETGSENELKFISLKEDGTDMQTLDIDFSQTDGSVSGEKPVGAANDQADGTDSGAADATTMEMNAGDMARAEAAAAAAGVSAIDSDMLVEENQTSENTYYGNFAIGRNGTLYAMKNYYYEDYSDPENYIYTQEYALCAWDLSGAFLWQAPIENLQTEDSYSYINKIIPAEDGSVNLLISGDRSGVLGIGADGVVTGEKKLTNGEEILNMSSDVLVKEDGSLIIIYYNDEWTEMNMVSYDINTDTVGDKTLLPDFLMWSGYNCMVAGVTTDVVYATSSGLFGYSAGDTEPTQLMSYVNSDLNTGGINNVIMLDDTHFFGFYNDRENNDSKGALFTKKNPEDIPDKSVIVLAGTYVGYDIKSHVVNFNKSNDEYRVVLKEYESYNTRDDYNAGFTKLNNDIISGQMPDILIADSSLPIENYISKGLIADIGKLIEQDEELSQVEFLENVFNAYSIDDTLYYVVPYFYVQSFMGKTSKLGDRDTWTIQEFIDFADSLPEDTNVIGELTRDYFMSMVMQYNGNDFIDMATGKCSFDSEDFISMLEFAKTLPEELSEDYYGEDYWMNYESQYREDRTILMPTHIASMRDMNTYMNGYFGEDVTFIGFPTSSGNGSIISAYDSFVLSSKSKILDGAWEFVRYYLTDEYQKSMDWGFPVSKEVFMEKAKEGLGRPYWVNENGEKEYYDNYWTVNGESVMLDPLTQEQLDQLIEVVTSADDVSYYNEDIQNIINEEAAAFFEGQKSVQEVVKIIQSRAQIFVDENR